MLRTLYRDLFPAGGRPLRRHRLGPEYRQPRLELELGHSSPGGRSGVETMRRGGCKVILRIGGAMCAALATTDTGDYAGAAGHHDRDTARVAALMDCQKGMVGDCIVRASYYNR